MAVGHSRAVLEGWHDVFPRSQSIVPAGAHLVRVQNYHLLKPPQPVGACTVACFMPVHAVMATRPEVDLTCAVHIQASEMSCIIHCSGCASTIIADVAARHDC